MIDLIPGLPDDVLGVSASGHVDADDYRQVLIPAVEASLAKHTKLRLLFVTAPSFKGYSAGAMWEDAKLGFHHLTHWRKAAIVSDVRWLRSAVAAFAFAIPCPVQLFRGDQLDEAKAWLAHD
ncbi:STAS/SEC14 domain-containing protein [Solimonas terrae]|uniref:STAS/SEC14 domain-containing protein n=1 Tax=Solimonas terrae TaxID=1396819 RepID=A0A6M2BNF6_9GAMM|nr:STAS/SEC14 domain-containing protein [Solimonas terrae]NGY03735.1 STAS/SEC14 domain-containing protein [Solimonas terrae]